jgi:heme iron utilization protein
MIQIQQDYCKECRRCVAGLSRFNRAGPDTIAIRPLLAHLNASRYRLVPQHPPRRPMTDRIDPIRETDDAARQQARAIIAQARTAALAFTHPDTGAPFISRIAIAVALGHLHALVSDLALHSRALAVHPQAALLLGEPGPRGDPMNHPRLSLATTAEPLPDTERGSLRAAWLTVHPDARIYVDFADFRFLRFRIQSGAMNAGFARSFTLTASDLSLP